MLRWGWLLFAMVFRINRWESFDDEGAEPTVPHLPSLSNRFYMHEEGESPHQQWLNKSVEVSMENFKRRWVGDGPEWTGFEIKLHGSGSEEFYDEIYSPAMISLRHKIFLLPLISFIGLWSAESFVEGSLLWKFTARKCLQFVPSQFYS